MSEKIITLSHGSGGKATHRIINDYIKKYLGNSILNKMEDGAVLNLNKKNIVMTTDSFTITPIFFSGGDIGRLAVSGTVNDICAMGAKPLYLTLSFIIEEGLSIQEFEKILISIKNTSKEAGVKVIAGDTKVVEKGKADKIFINTTGIGEIIKKGISVNNAKNGDKVIITGFIGEHEVSILKDRKNIDFKANIKSDCAPLSEIIEKILKKDINIHVMRDPTRGGLATVLNEISEASNVEITIYENKIPVRKEVRTICNVLGFDPLYLANEGKMVIISDSKSADEIIKILKSTKYGKNTTIIGEIKKSKYNRVILKTISGGERILFLNEGEQLPRIC